MNAENAIARVLEFNLPQGQSAFLWGPRKCGKTTYLHQKYSGSIWYDFLNTDLRFRMMQNPAQLRQEILATGEKAIDRQPVILDEVQRVPEVLDEVQWLIDNKSISFVLCGSSARKLKRGHANMLGGRAWRFELHPFCCKEIDNFDLLKALNNGLIPAHYLAGDASRSLKAYVLDYLKEEIQQEGLVRNIKSFSRFTDILGFCNGELVNYSNIARETGVDSKTVKEYFSILVDTLLGDVVDPFAKRNKRAVLTATPKFYLFDTGVAAYLRRQKIAEMRGPEFGRAFEHFIFMELAAYKSYSEKDFAITFWRTPTGLEVDFIINNAEVAIEVKGTSNISNKETKGLRAFIEEHKPSKAIIVCTESRKRISGDILILPWQEFLEQLWDGSII